jgi:hypothetical protein
MSVDLERPPVADAEIESYAHYRALSTLAVVSCVLGVLSVLAFLDWSLAVIPFVGAFCGAVALRRIRANASELSGQGLAKIGLALSFLFFAGGWSLLTFEYMTEVPEGYERLSYAQLQPDADNPGKVIPPSAMDWNGKQVFIKGYMYPGAQDSGITTFILCRDNGDCCFGGQPKMTDRIQVKLKKPLTAKYHKGLRRLAGTFRVEPGRGTDELAGVLYHLDADYLK